MKDIRSKIYGWLLGGMMILVFVTSTVHPVMAQNTNGWAPDQRIPGYSNDTYTPILVADQNRTVHAFASQYVGYDKRQLAIFYRQWSLSGGWTKPVDILLSSRGDAQIQGAYLDSAGIMHIIFWAGVAKDAYIYYSKAPVTNADQSSAWSSPIAIGEAATEPVSASLSGDGQGNLVVIYNGNVDGAGVYEIHSKDSGNTWSQSRAVFLTNDVGLVPYSIRLYAGRENQLHATWNVVTQLGVDVSLYYARYDMADEKWTKPIMLDKRVEVGDAFGPSIPSIVEANGHVVIMYNSGNPLVGGSVAAGRPVQMVSVSEDGGGIWNVPVVPFSSFQGKSGEHSLAVDSNGVAHALFIQRIDQLVDGNYTSIDGIWHSAYQNGVWSDPDRFLPSLAPHDIHAVVSQGNVLLVVWRQDPGQGTNGIWYSYRILNAPELPVIPLPTAQAFSSVAASPSLESIVQSTLTPVFGNNLLNDHVPASSFAVNPTAGLLLGMLPVVILLILVILSQSLRSKK